MHGWETRMLLRHSLQRGVSKAALARRFGVSRRTIHEWVETGQLDRDLSSGGGRYSPRPAVPHKLAPYTGIIEARLEEFPGLSATRLFDEVRAAGYPGGYSRVRDYVRAVRPREPVEAVVRFETPAGRQGQVDFATFTRPWGRRHALVVVLSHSRLLWLRFYRRQTMAVLTEGLERAFARFGGVPTERLFDQMRAVVLSDGHVGGGELVLNAEFLRVAAHWGFHPRQLLLRARVRERRGPQRAGVALAGGHGRRRRHRPDRAPRDRTDDRRRQLPAQGRHTQPRVPHATGGATPIVVVATWPPVAPLRPATSRRPPQLKKGGPFSACHFHTDRCGAPSPPRPQPYSAAGTRLEQSASVN